jgi:predicted Fe-Mo cluster-binding NifX family protein
VFVSIKNPNVELQNSAGIKASEIIIENGAEILLTGHVGDKAENILEKAKIKMITGYDSSIQIKDAINSYLTKK